MFVFILMLSSLASAQTLPPSRAPQASLHESIQREVYATTGRGRNMIFNQLMKQNNPESSLPYLALYDSESSMYSNQVAEATAFALNAAEREISAPWTTCLVYYFACAALSEQMAFSRSAPPRIIEKLSRVKVNELDPSEAVILLLALESNGVESRAKWRALAQLLARASFANSQQATITSVAMSGLCHIMAAPRGNMSAPPPAALAHMVWVWKRLDEMTSPAAFYFALAASRLPRSFFMSDNPPIPLDWRDGLANHLISRQVYDSETGGFRWGEEGDTAWRETAYAILALMAVSD